MRRLTRYLGLFWLQLKSSALLTMQYRADFVIDGVLSLFWASTALIPLFTVYRGRAAIAGWSFGEALVVLGWFIFLQGILEGVINPGLQAVVDHIRWGTLDFVLLKPADAQFLVSTSKFNLFRIFNLVSAAVVFGFAFRVLGRWPTVGGLASAALLLVTATVLLYSLWILTVSAAFYVVQVDNLIHLFNAIFDAARWPVHVFRGALRVVFTFVLPLALMTTYPAEALLGRLDLRALVLSVVGTVAFATLSRWVWLKSLGRYTSASS